MIATPDPLDDCPSGDIAHRLRLRARDMMPDGKGTRALMVLAAERIVFLEREMERRAQN